MDMYMPEMNGLDAARAIRSRETAGGSRTPIVALTASATGEDRQLCLDAGMDAHLAKPMTRQALADALQGVMAGAA